MPKQAQAKTRRNNERAVRDLSRNGTKPKSAQDERDIRDARGALKESRKKGSIPWEQVKREAGM